MRPEEWLQEIHMARLVYVKQLQDRQIIYVWEREGDIAVWECQNGTFQAVIELKVPDGKEETALSIIQKDAARIYPEAAEI